MTDEPADATESRAVPWGLAEILLVFLAYTLVFGLGRQALSASGLFPAVYGPGFTSAGDSPQAKANRIRESLWAACLFAPAQLAVAVALVRGMSGATFEQLGLVPRRVGFNVLLGLALFVVFTPGCYVINFVATRALESLGAPSQPHPFAELGKQATAGELALIVVAGVVVAPLWEEFFYRGLIQRWVLDRGTAAGWFALSFALLLTLAARYEHLSAAVRAGDHGRIALEAVPFAVLAAIVAVFAFLTATARSRAAGLLAVAAVFAFAHARVWPSPLALSWLAVGLGSAALVGRNLVAPMVMHAAFNAVACVSLVWTSR